MNPFKNIFQLGNVSIGLSSTNSKTFRHSKEDTAQGLMHKLPLYLRREQQTDRQDYIAARLEEQKWELVEE